MSRPSLNAAMFNALLRDDSLCFSGQHRLKVTTHVSICQLMGHWSSASINYAGSGATAAVSMMV
ncbi:MAG: hypothetical protein JO100_12455 [Pseudonocardia sp.]|nr:hypothetical protein [Pseudonocardia sp.]